MNQKEAGAARIEELVGKIENISDTESRKIAVGLVEAIVQLYGAGIERMMDIVFESGDAGEKTIRLFAKDELISGLLVLHGLHPDDFERRAHDAVNKLHGKAEMLGVFEGAVRVRLTESGRGLKESVEAALANALPDATSVTVEEATPATGFVPLSALAAALPERI